MVKMVLSGVVPDIRSAGGLAMIKMDSLVYK